MKSMEIIQFSRPPAPLSICVQKSSNYLTLDVQFQTKSPSPNGNQSIQIRHNPRMTLICYQVLPSAFFFSINSLISSSFHLTLLHLAEASLSAFSWLTLVCEVAQKYYEMYFTYNRTVHVNERNQNKKSCLIQIEHLFHCLIYPRNNAMVSLKDGFTVWRQSQKEDFLSIINYMNVWLSMMSDYGANLIFFNKKK